MPSVIKGDVTGSGRRIAIAVSRFNELITQRLLEGALGTLRQRGVAEEAVTVAWVPGAFELPLACRWLSDSGRFDAILALGAVIRGETSHFDYICAEVARGLAEVGRTGGVPVAFGVLTCETTTQAMERSGPEVGNKGAEAALAALEMAALAERLAVPRAADSPAPG